MTMNPVAITILALMPISVFCYYQIQERIGIDQKRERQEKFKKLAEIHPDRFEVIDGELRIKQPASTKMS